LPDAERDHAEKVQEDAEETFRREGADAAFKKFVALAAVNYEDREPDVVLAPPTAERTANLSFFFTYESPAVRRYRIDIAALSALSTRVLAACGTSAPQSAPYRVATALAAKFGKAPVEFPGGHTGWLLRPKGFAATLCEILR